MNESDIRAVVFNWLDALEGGMDRASVQVGLVSALASLRPDGEAVLPDDHVETALEILCSVTGERRQHITDDVRLDQLCDAARCIAALATLPAAGGEAVGWIHEVEWTDGTERRFRRKKPELLDTDGLNACLLSQRIYQVAEITHPAPAAREAVPEGAVAWTEAEFAKLYGAEVGFMRRLSEAAWMPAECGGMLRHCAKLLEGRATVPDDMVARFKLAARTLIRERKVYGEDVETLHDVLRVLESLAAAPPPQANGPDYSDGCDSEGFPGGCARMGHTPETCPQAKPVSSQYRDQRVRENVQRVADILHPQAKPPCADPHISEVCGNADKAKPQEGECPVCHKAWGEHRSGYSASQCKHTPPAAPADEGREVDWSERAAWCAQSILLLLGHVESRRDHHGTSIGHYRWMAEELAAKRVGSATKACRWLGYLQGGLVHAGYTTLEAEKQRNLDSLKVEGR